MTDFSLPTALFGGSFDPVHEGHLHVAREVLARVPEIKQFVFVPAGQSPGKPPSLATGEQRLRWLQLAAGAQGWGAWDIELNRRGESYTVHTLASAHQKGATRDTLFWVLGADAYERFPSWREPGRIRALCRLLVVNRPGSSLAPQKEDDLIVTIPPHPASSSEIRAQLASGDYTNAWIPALVRAELEKFLPLQCPYVRKR
jgi:nicotinate-nucleotide adenylyltransferase